MIKFSKFGAAALALALTVTFVTPTTVLAASTKQELQRNHELSDSDSVISTTKERVAGPFSYSDMQAAAVSAGYAIKDEEGGLTWNKGYDYEWDDDDNYYIIKRTYKNNATGKTGTSEDEINTRYSKDDYKFQSAIRVRKGDVCYLAVPLSQGDTTIKAIKSSKKSIFTAKLDSKQSIVYDTNETVDYDWEKNADGSYTYFYYNSLGKKVILGTSTDENSFQAALKATNRSSATRVIKVTGKKTGNGKLSFDVYDKNNKKTGKVTIKVYVQDDTSPLKVLTFAGKSLLKDYSSSKNINYGKTNADNDWNISKKNKGKLVVKANKNYTIKKIEVGTLYKENKTYTSPSGSYSYSYSYSTTSHDGEPYKWTTVKSGKTITLSKVGLMNADENIANENYGSDYNYNESDTYGDKTHTYKETHKTSALIAPTVIRITYYDKLTKTYSSITKIVYRKIK